MLESGVLVACMYCAFAVVVRSVVNCSAPAPAGAVESTTKFTAPPGLVSSVVQPCVFVGVTTTVLAALAPATASASVNDTKTPVPLNSFLTCSPLFVVGPVLRPRRDDDRCCRPLRRFSASCSIVEDGDAAGVERVERRDVADQLALLMEHRLRAGDRRGDAVVVNLVEADVDRAQKRAERIEPRRIADADRSHTRDIAPAHRSLAPSDAVHDAG